MTCQIVSSLTYGRVAKSLGDPIFESFLKVMADFVKASDPGQWLVDVIPARA